MTDGWLSPAEWEAVRLSLRVATVAMLLCLLPAVALGWCLARKRFRGKLVLESLVMLPMVLPPVVPGYVLLVLLGNQGVVGSRLKQSLGVEFIFNWKGAALAAAVIALPLMVQTARIAFQWVDRRLEAVASTLGAPPWRVFLTVTLPLALPGILAGMVLGFCRALGEFGATITFVGNIPGETQTLPLAIYAALQQMDGEPMALRLIALSTLLSFTALLVTHALTRIAAQRLGRLDD